MVTSTVVSVGAVDQTARDAASVADGKAVTAQTDATTGITNAATADGKAVAAQTDATYAKITTRVDVKATRTFNTVYQNTSGKVMHVQVVAEDPTEGYTLHMESDAATPPTHLVSSEVSITGGESGTVYGMVLPNHYYKVTYAGATIVSWYETT